MSPLQKKYCRASDKVVECEECEKRFQASCAKLGDDELSKLESDNGPWYCANCKTDCGLCSKAVLNSQKAVQCDKCTSGFTMNALTSQKPCMKLCKIHTVPGFARNATSSVFPILSLTTNQTWKIKTNLNP